MFFKKTKKEKAEKMPEPVIEEDDDIGEDLPDLCVFLTKANQVLNIKSRAMNLIELPKDSISIPFLSINSYANIDSLKAISRMYGKSYVSKIKRIYFGVETCEHLIPSIEDIKTVIDFCNQEKYEFTFVTPLVGDIGVEKINPILEYLNTLNNIEVVFNDYAILNLLITKFTNLSPVLGRILIKLKRDPRYTSRSYPTNTNDLDDVEEIKLNQFHSLQSCSLEIPVYQKFLKNSGISRVGTDLVISGLDYIEDWGFTTDIYYPWTYVTSSRACKIAAVTQIDKEKHPTNTPCTFQCKLLESEYTSDLIKFDTLEKGNAVWMTAVKLIDSFDLTVFDRLIYQPYIPV